MVFVMMRFGPDHNGSEGQGKGKGQISFSSVMLQPQEHKLDSLKVKGIETQGSVNGGFQSVVRVLSQI